MGHRIRVPLLVLVLCACVGAMLPSPTGAVSAPSGLPSTKEGPRPGPPVLYQALPVVPELSVRAPFQAKPLLVSGTDAYCAGEYLYQDYLFDDHGANTSASFPGDEVWGLFPPAGDVRYPPEARYANNAADIVEVRMRPTSDAVVFRVTLNTVLASDATAVGIGIDKDRAGPGSVTWPDGAGVSSPGLDAFVTAWGTGGRFATRPSGTSALSKKRSLPAGAVAIDRGRNQMTITLPRTWLDPKGTWRLVAGAGLWNGTSFKPVDDEAPAIFNLAFRFDEKQGGDNRGNTFIGYGNWFDESQSAALAEGTSGDAFADVTWSKLTDPSCRPIHGPKADQARILASRLRVPEGVHAGDAPNFGGRLQPYMLHLPTKRAEAPGLTLALHGNSANYTQWIVSSPRYLEQIGNERNHIVVSPLGRSTAGSGIIYDFFEAWADVAHRRRLDPERVSLSGYSAGGYHTFVVASQYPDLFGRAFAIVGAARLLDGGVEGDHTNFIPMLGNLRWVPTVSWNQLIDELAPYIGIRVTHQRLNELGLRNVLYTFPVGEHLTPGLLDEWDGGAAYLGTSTVKRDPYRVDHTIAPETWKMLSPQYGAETRFPQAHLKADHAYWVSSLQARGPVRDETNTIRGSISATSHAYGYSDPVTERVLDLYAGPPTPATIDGTAWAPLQRGTRRNALTVQMSNLRNATIWGRRALLSASKALTIEITSDGPANVRVVLPFGQAPRVTRLTAPAKAAKVSFDDDGVLLGVPQGTSRFVISPA